MSWVTSWVSQVSEPNMLKVYGLNASLVVIRERALAEDYPDRLASQHALAIAHRASGQVGDAVALLKQVVATEARTLAEGHPSRLASQHALASAYRASGEV